jgi:hypothetical protein
MSKIVIGHAAGHAVGFDLDILLTTRALVQANSGGGKSYLLRRLCEQLFGKVQVIIIDPEGEFSTLREKHGYVLVGKGGETPADPRSAALVAEKLLELNASAVCDIYELKAEARHRWVKAFLDALVNARKELWHPCIVVVDEAHVFAPEKGQGESEAYGAMIDLATRGRKRGFCAIFATQRLGKLSKNASAELQNVLIGSTFQDVDRKRAAETLGIPKTDERAFFDELKLLEPGNFYCLGRAISRDRVKVRIAEVDTSHPQPGSSKFALAPPPLPEKVKALLPSLADLPKEAEEKAHTEADLRREITSLKQQLAAKPRAELDQSAIERAVQQSVSSVERQYREQIQKLTEQLSRMQNVLTGIARQAGEFTDVQIPLAKIELPKLEAPRPSAVVYRKSEHLRPSSGAGEKLPRAERSILIALAQYPDGRTKVQVALLCGYAHSGGGFNNALGALRSKEYIEGSDTLRITGAGMNALGTYDPLPTGDALLQHWYRNLGKAERSILQVCVENYPNALSKEQVADMAGYEVGGGGFNNALGRLRTLELIEGRGELRASEDLF